MQGITGVNEKVRLKCALLNEDAYCAHSVNYFILTEEQPDYTLLLGILNSKFLNWYFKIFNTNSNVNSYEIENLPIANFSSNSQKELVNIVNKILKITEANDYKNDRGKQDQVNVFEKQIDRIVYEQYGISSEEIALVESD